MFLLASALKKLLALNLLDEIANEKRWRQGFLRALVPEQEYLTCYVPTVLGPVEHREWKEQLERIHGYSD